MTQIDPFRRRRAIEPRSPKESYFSPHTSLGPGNEFDAIRRLLERWGPRARRIGDDAAMITTLGERVVVSSIDSSVENVHFRRDWLTPEEIGYRSAMAALSDLAAMGSTPVGMLVALTIPESWGSSLDAIGDGIGEAAAASDALILGGDMSAGNVLSLTFSVIGTARDVMCRTAARSGDRVYVTGRLGGPWSALQDLQAGHAPADLARRRFARPVARIREAIWLSEHGATAAVDVSDGLAADLGHVAAASRVTITVDLEKLPVIEGVSPIDAARSGEEYEIAVTSQGELNVTEFESKFLLGLTVIGEVTAGDAEVRVMHHGARVEAPPGYLHSATLR